MASKTRMRWLLAAAVTLCIAGFFLFDLDRYFTLEVLKAQQAELTDWVARHGTGALLLYSSAYMLITALSLPGAAIMTLLGGALFGVLVGTVIVSFASSIGATLAFLGSRFLLRDAVRARFGHKLSGFERGLQRDGPLYLFTLRLVPVFPFFLINLVMGLTALPAWPFYWVSQVGMLPGTIAYVYAGTQLATISGPGDIVTPGVIGALALLGFLPWILRILLRQLLAVRTLRAYTRPGRYDYNLIVIGAGSAGLVSAYIGAALKAKIALVEAAEMGGDCLNRGCVPSKALLRSAQLLADARDSRRYGIRECHTKFDFADIMQRVRASIEQIAPHDSAERYRGLGVDVLKGYARIVDPWTVEVDGSRLSARGIIVATGARPLIPNLPGLADLPYLTSDSVWELSELPNRLVVLGGGPIGCELAQAFRRFGSGVTLVEMAPRLLPREDPDVSTCVAEALAREGLHIATGHKGLRIDRAASGHVLVCEHQGNTVTYPFDRILIALGRAPNVQGFGLEALGVRLSERGTIAADQLMRTNFPSIYVCGDVTGPYQFTHVAAHQAWYASINALLAPFWSFNVDYRVIPWCTFTDPQAARVGLSEEEARSAELPFEITKYGIDDLDRAIVDGAAGGFVKVLTPPGSDKILGATVVGAHAGELIAEFVLAMKHGLGLNKILGTIHTYPTLMEANKYAAGVWKRAHAPAGALQWLQRFFTWRRQ